MKNKFRWMAAAALALLLAVPANAAAEYDLLPLPAENAEAADTRDDLDAAADENMSPEEAAGTLYEPSEPAAPPDFGAPGRGEVENPDKYWAVNGYPDFVSFAFEAGGELLDDGTVETWWEIGLVGGGAALEGQVLDLLAPTCRVRFVTCRCSYDQRQAALDEILARNDPRITQAVLGQNTEAVFVWTSEADRSAVQSELDAAYGPMKVEVLDSMVVEDSVTAGMGLDQGGLDGADAASPLPWALAFTALLLGVGGTLLLRRRPAAVTADGQTVSAAPLSRAAAIRTVRERTLRPSPTVWDALRRTLGK